MRGFTLSSSATSFSVKYIGRSLVSFKFMTAFPKGGIEMPQTNSAQSSSMSIHVPKPT